MKESRRKHSPGVQGQGGPGESVKKLVGVLAFLGVIFVGLMITSIAMGYGPFTMIAVIVGYVLQAFLQ